MIGSSTAFAEGGSERAQQFYENFRVNQQQIHGNKTENIANIEKPDNNNSSHSVADTRKQPKS
ncbi:hypothetical protein [Pseudomonas sp. LD120]|uniref:hypothetical protein n=1 Tax=Pseudomonas sp. LD120 TaxID=485751 RepID=UPI001C49C0AA|nr:hypothetical protein [Pseudomonas sp. LD120]